MAEALEAYVQGYTHGPVSRTESIRLLLNQPPDPEPEAGSEADPTLLAFASGIEATLVWEDPQTLVLTPLQPLPSGREFTLIAKLGRIFPEIPSREARFSFNIFTLDQFLTLELEGMQAADMQDLSRQTLKLTVFSVDFMENELLENHFTARQGDRDLEMSWSHSADGRSHGLEVSGIERLDEESSLTLSWDGEALHLSEGGSRDIRVPALGEFTVTDVKVAYNPDPYFVIQFSDPLQSDQDLTGLVSIAGLSGQPRWDIQGEQLLIYPGQRVSGSLDLEFHEGIRNIQGKELAPAGPWALEVEGIKPAVRAVGEGVILPGMDNLLFPFEVMGLNAVEVEVFKVFHNNILQFLQNQDLDDNYGGLRQVGRVIHRQRVDLNKLTVQGSRGEWARYAIDLGPWLEEDPASIYQVRIGFRPEYADYACPNMRQEVVLDETYLPEDLMEWWFGPSGYYSDYSYEHRDDPCYPAYYNSDRFLSRNLLASSLGLIVKGNATGNYFAAVTDLRNTTSLVGATVTYFDFQQQEIASGETDSRGVISLELDREPFAALARHGNDRAYLRLMDGDALAMSAFDITGSTIQDGIKGFLYAERGVWRPGDSIYLNLILNEDGQDLPDDYPVSLEFFDPMGRRQEERTVNRPTGPIYPLHLSTPDDALTGNWLARVKVGGATFEKSLPVETIQPNRLSVDLEFPGESLSASDQPFRTQLQVNWLQGAPGRNLRATVEATLRQDPDGWDGYPGFVFQDPTRNIQGASRNLYEGRVNAQGSAAFSTTLLSGKEAPGKLLARFTVRAFEPGGAFSTREEEISFHPYPAYVGIRIPENSFGVKKLNVGEDNPVEVRLIRPDGSPSGTADLNAGMYRLDWRWWWEAGNSNVSRFNASDLMRPMGGLQSLRTDAEGKAGWSVRPERWGRYLLRICDPQGGHCTGSFFYAGSPGPGSEGYQREAATMISLSTDKEVYRPGEIVTLTVPAGGPGRMLVALENGTRVVQHFWAEPGNTAGEVTFRVTPEMAPNVYAHVLFIQPHGQQENDLPMRLYGIQSVRVEDPDTRLQPEIAMPETLRPEESFSVQLSERNGKSMYYTIAIVDEGLLALTNFSTPDPHAHMFAREALGVKTWDLFDKVLGNFGGTPQRILTIGGDGTEIEPPDGETANRFKPVVLEKGPFLLPANQTVTHSFTMPNYVGSVRAMVVAASQEAYGMAARQSKVSQPLMVLGTLPRVLSPGEQVMLPVTVFAMEPSVESAQVRVRSQGDRFTWTGPESFSPTFDGPGEKTLFFPFEVGPDEGVARLNIQATSNSGISAGQDMEVMVRNPNPIQTDTYRRVLDPNENWAPAYTLAGTPSDREVTLELSRMPPLNLRERLSYLREYPFGSLETVVSAAFVQLHLPNLTDPDAERQREVTGEVREGIDNLSRYQLPGGGFAYWPGQSRASDWGTSYAGHFLLEARNEGYALPSGILDNWLSFQQQASRNWQPRNTFDDRRFEQLDQAYRLYTLALAQRPDLAAMNRMREMNELETAARWRLAAAYGLAGRMEVAEALIQNAGTDIDPYTYPGRTFGSSLRDRAMIMETLLLLNRQSDAAELLQELSDALASDRWLSTQTTAMALLAAARFVEDDPPQGNLSFSLATGGDNPVRGGSNAALMQVAIPSDRQSLSLQNLGNGKLFARLVIRARPEPGPVAARNENLQLQIRYLDQEGEPLAPASLIQGTDFLVEARVKHTGSLPFDYENLALEQIFPSGWEIIPSGMPGDRGTDSPSSSYLYQEINDDRVRTYFDLRPGEEKVFMLRLNAAYLGRFYLPPSQAEAMYDGRIRASSASAWVEVIRPPS